jgi:hypothetical protein
MIEMEKLEGRTFIDMYLRITDFLLPKQARISAIPEDQVPDSEKFQELLDLLHTI